MKQFLDFIPAVVFFVVFKLYGISIACAALIVSSAAVLLFTWYKYRKIEKMTLVIFALVVVFATLTIIFHDSAFIKWKVTIVYVLLSLSLLISQFFFKKILIQSMLGKEISLPHHVWSRLNIAWALFFLACAALNVYVAFTLKVDLDTWMNFKLVTFTVLTLVFSLGSGIYMYRNMSEDDKQKMEKGKNLTKDE